MSLKIWIFVLVTAKDSCVSVFSCHTKKNEIQILLKLVHVLPSLFFPAKQTQVVPGGAIGSASGFRIFGDRKVAGSKPARGHVQLLEFALRASGKYERRER